MSVDPLGQWLREKGVWLKDLHVILSQEGVVSLEDFQALPEAKFKEIVKKARLAGLMADKPQRLRAAYKGRKYKPKKKGAKKKKKKKKGTKLEAPALLTASSCPIASKPPVVPSKPSESEVRKVLQPFLEEAKCWTIDTFKVMYNDFDICEASAFQSLSAERFEELLREVRLKGLTGKKVTYFRGLWRGYSTAEVDKIAKEHKQKKRSATGRTRTRAKSYTSAATKKITVTKRKRAFPAEIVEEAKAKLEPWLREHDIWMVDMVDAFLEHGISTPEKFYALDETAFYFLFDDAKSKGLIGGNTKILKALYYRTRVPRRDRDSLPSLTHLAMEAQAAVEEKQTLTAEGKTRDEVRVTMEPYMRKKGYWQLDMFFILFEAGVYEPSDLADLSKEKLDEIIRSSRLKGFMGRGPINLEEDWRRRWTTSPRAKPRRVRFGSFS